VNGVFHVLARMAPIHFRVDRERWASNAGHIAIHPVNCAPMVRIRRMTGNAECHMCGRCAGHLDAVTLASRSPNAEVLDPHSEPAAWDAILIVVGVIGVAIGAFQWSASPWFVQAKVLATELVVDRGPAWLLSDNAPWWLLTHYPEASDVFTWLDGALIVAYIATVAIVLSGTTFAALYAAALAVPGARWRNVWRLSHALIPLAGLGVFLGLSSLTVSLARAEGMWLGWVPWMRAALLAAGASWSAYLFWRMLATVGVTPRRIAAWLACCAAIGVIVAAWAVLFIVWAPVR